MQIEQMTLQDKGEAIHWWQYFSGFHRLTCGVNSSHMELVPDYSPDDSTSFKLLCIDCGYVQTYIPEVIFDAYLHLGK
jgi:hypothetical protein